MAKIRHNNIIDTVDEIFSLAKDQGSLHLYADDIELDGRFLSINNNKALHFGTCGYMGLENHPDLVNGAIQAINRYGVQFPMSKTYVSNPLYTELEHLIEKMYDAPVVISKNCTLSHLAVVPTLIKQSDLIILDHQVHTSVQEAVRKQMTKGVDVEMIRHNNLEMLEDRIRKLHSKYDKIWYMADGVYSMYGDFAPIKELIALAEKYEQLHLYVDDAHGMSWAGRNGAGYVMSQMQDGLYRKMILTSTMGKAFGACGGLTLFPNKEWQRKVKTFGGPLTFSVQMEPPILGAAMASAHLHLSDQIYEYQEDLRSKISYANELMKKTDLTLITDNISPIFYIGTGTMEVGNKLINRLINDGIYVNLAPFPGVPAKNTGLRVTISRHNRIEDIEEMSEKLSYHFDTTLKEVRQSKSNIWKAFKMEPRNVVIEENPLHPTYVEGLKITNYSSIKDLDKNLWNDCLGHRGMFDWSGMKFLESCFTKNSKKEHNWRFNYYHVKDQSGKTLLLTVFVTALYKEDMFSRVSISKAIEEIRVKDPYYLTSNAIVMGSLFTEGNHIFINREDKKWKDACRVLISELYKEQDKNEASNIIFRDLPAEDKAMDEFMMEQGFVKVDMPKSCVVDNFDWDDEQSFKTTLTKKNRKHFNLYVKKFEKYFDVVVKKSLDESELVHAMNLFQNVRDNNLAINSFNFPAKLFHEMNFNPNWEFVMLYMKDEFDDNDKAVGVCFCQKNENEVYSFMLVGMDYNYVKEYGVYRQALYNIVKRAKQLGSRKANLGISAAIEKKRVGAVPYEKVAYFQAADNYITEMMESTIVLERD
ncbi:MAG: aminotransferase class I/II-fold pyridoxal phosphate-dependent enzyme [Bacteroidota bacterium]